MKRLLSLAIASAMTLSMGAVSFAYEPGAEMGSESSVGESVVSLEVIDEDYFTQVMENEKFNTNNQAHVKDVNSSETGVFTISIDAANMTPDANGWIPGEDLKWFALHLVAPKALFVENGEGADSHEGYDEYTIDSKEDIEPWGWNFEPAGDENCNVILWLRAEAPKRVIHFPNGDCLFLEIVDVNTEQIIENKVELNIINSDYFAQVMENEKFNTNNQAHVKDVNSSETGVFTISIDAANMTPDANGWIPGEDLKWFALHLVAPKALFVENGEGADSHEGYDEYTIDSKEDIEPWGWNFEPAGDENCNVILWLRAEAPKRVIHFPNGDCLFLEIVEYVEETTPTTPSTPSSSNNGPSAAETAASEAKSDVTAAVSNIKSVASDIAALTGGLPVAQAGTTTAAELEKICKDAGLKTLTIETTSGKSVVPVISIPLTKMEGRFSYVLNDMLVGTGLYLEFVGSDGVTYVVPTSALTKSATNRIFFTESYLINLAINK